MRPRAMSLINRQGRYRVNSNKVKFFFFLPRSGKACVTDLYESKRGTSFGISGLLRGRKDKGKIAFPLFRFSYKAIKQKNNEIYLVVRLILVQCRMTVFV